MNDYIGKICPYCKTPIQENDEIVVCSSCEMPHHRDCWVENQGCTTFGCQGTINTPNSGAQAPAADYYNPAAQQAPVYQANVVYCTSCGSTNGADVRFCVSCGQPIQPVQQPVNPAPNPSTYVQNSYPQQSYAAPQQPIYLPNTYYQQAQQPAATQPTYQAPAYGAQQTYSAPNNYGTQQQPGYTQNPYSQSQYNAANPYESVPGYQTAPNYSQYAIDPDIQFMIGSKTEYYIPKFQTLMAENKKTSWNWPAFLITPYWLIYRKMYVYGAAWLGAMLILNLINAALANICALVGYIAFGVLGNYIYLNHLSKNAQESKTMQEPYRSDFMNKNRDVNLVAAILSAVGYVILFALIAG